MRIWTYKNADEKAHTFSRGSKNVKKRTKNEYCVNSSSQFFSGFPRICEQKIPYFFHA